MKHSDSIKKPSEWCQENRKGNLSFLLLQVNLTFKKITQTFNFQLQCHVVENAEAEKILIIA